MVESLFEVDTTTGDIMDTVLFNSLPIVLPIPVHNDTKVCLTPSDHEQQLHGLFENWGVYTNHNTDMFIPCEGWDKVMDMAWTTDVVDDTEITADNLLQNDSWLRDNVTRDITFSVDGVHVTVEVGRENVEDEDEEEEGGEDVGYESIHAYFEEKVDTILGGGEVPNCGVCLESECNAIVRCGHMMCFVCAVKISKTPVPMCPHCRYEIADGDIFTVGVEFTSTAMTWMRGVIDDFRASKETVLFIGSDAPGVSYIKEHIDDPCILHESEVAGKLQTGVSTCVLLDESATVPITMSNSGGRGVNVIRLCMEF